MNINKQVRYNSVKSGQPGRTEWFFCIVDQRKEICEISNRIWDLFSPILDEGRIFEGDVAETGLGYKLLNFETVTKVGENDFRGIYSRMIKDRKLNRGNPDGLENYLSAKFGH